MHSGLARSRCGEFDCGGAASDTGTKNAAITQTDATELQRRLLESGPKCFDG